MVTFVRCILFGLILMGTVGGCKSNATVAYNLRDTELATQAMERAKKFEADVYAPREYTIAQRFYSKMNRELTNKNYPDALQTAKQVIDAANEATRVARIVEEIKK